MKLSVHLAITLHLALLASAAPTLPSKSLKRANGHELVSPNSDNDVYGSLKFKSGAQTMNLYDDDANGDDNNNDADKKRDVGNNMPVSMTPNSEATFPGADGEKPKSHGEWEEKEEKEWENKEDKEWENKEDKEWENKEDKEWENKEDKEWENKEDKEWEKEDKEWEKEDKEWEKEDKEWEKEDKEEKPTATSTWSSPEEKGERREVATPTPSGYPWANWGPPSSTPSSSASAPATATEEEEEEETGSEMNNNAAAPAASSETPSAESYEAPSAESSEAPSAESSETPSAESYEAPSSAATPKADKPSSGISFLNELLGGL